MAYTVSYENVIFILYTLRLGFAHIDQIEQALEICRTTPGLKIADVLIEMGAIDAGRRQVVEREAIKALEESDTLASVVDSPPGDGESATARQAARNLVNIDDASDQMITEEQAGRYSTVRQHAVGGQARIVVTFDEHLRREVALKELVFNLEEPTGGTPTTGQRHSAGLIRFLR